MRFLHLFLQPRAFRTPNSATFFDKGWPGLGKAGGTDSAFPESVAAPQDLRDRTEAFALRVVRFCEGVAERWSSRRIAEQLFDAGTAVGANYRAARRARSDREFVSKIGVVLEESDESVYWLSLLKRSHLAAGQDLDSLLTEANELTAIFTTAHKTATENLQAKRALKAKARR
jgi:four helix bundle protein